MGKAPTNHQGCSPVGIQVAYLGVRIAAGDGVVSSLQPAGERLGLSVTTMSVTQSTEAAFRGGFRHNWAGFARLRLSSVT